MGENVRGNVRDERRDAAKMPKCTKEKCSKETEMQRSSSSKYNINFYNNNNNPINNYNYYFKMHHAIYYAYFYF